MLTINESDESSISFIRTYSYHSWLATTRPVWPFLAGTIIGSGAANPGKKVEDDGVPAMANHSPEEPEKGGKPWENHEKNPGCQGFPLILAATPQKTRVDVGDLHLFGTWDHPTNLPWECGRSPHWGFAPDLDPHFWMVRHHILGLVGHYVICTHVCMYVCMYRYVCMYVSICMYVCMSCHVMSCHVM